MMLRDLSPGWVLYGVVVWTVAVAFVCVALIVLLPPLVQELRRWSREAFHRRRSDVVSIAERRRLNALVGREGESSWHL
jgi:hypothetical protein